jgi:hypothetical protein
MPYATTSLSTSAVPGNSGALSVNWRGGKPFTANVTTASSSGVGDFTLQFCLADLTSSGIPTSSAVGLPGPSWQNLTAANFGISSAVVSSAGYGSLHFQSSTVNPLAGITWVSNAPIAGIRLNSTALSSTVLTLTLLQGEGF